MAFVEMDDAPRISWRDHFHEVEVYVTARRVAELHGYESCHHCLLLPPAGLAELVVRPIVEHPLDEVRRRYATSITSRMITQTNTIVMMSACLSAYWLSDLGVHQSI